jgi:hypothetical protein
MSYPLNDVLGERRNCCVGSRVHGYMVKGLAFIVNRTKDPGPQSVTDDYKDEEEEEAGPPSTFRPCRRVIGRSEAIAIASQRELVTVEFAV